MKKTPDLRTDGQRDGRRDGRTDGETDGPTDSKPSYRDASKHKQQVKNKQKKAKIPQNYPFLPSTYLYLQGKLFVFFTFSKSIRPSATALFTRCY